MSDLISRQAAIEAVHKTIYGFFDIVDDDSEEQFTKEEERFLVINKAITTRIKSLPSAQPEQRWIPVSERLPEEGQACLVADKGSITIDTYIGYGNPYNWRWYVRDYEAWQPLPEPYRNET